LYARIAQAFRFLGTVENTSESAAVSRGQNQLHLASEDWRNAINAIEPMLGRLDPTSATTQMLVLASDTEAVAALASALTPLATARSLRVLGATGARRAARVIQTLQPHLIVATSATVLELQQATVLKLEHITVAVLAWVDALGAAGTRALETAMGGIPKDAARIVIAVEATPAVEEIVERYARRPRRVQETGDQHEAASPISFVATNEAGRLDVLRRLLDALDPTSAAIVCRPESTSAVQSLLRAMGYGDDSRIRVTESGAGEMVLVILFDAPSGTTELRAAVGDSPAKVVALITARQVATLRRIAGGGAVPLSLPEGSQRARSREEALRDELRVVLTAGQYSRELIAIEPLLAEFDGAEVAAAALRLLDAERSKPAPIPTVAAPPSRPFSRDDRGGRDRGDRPDRGPRGERPRGDRGDRGDRGPRRDARPRGPGGPRGDRHGGSRAR
jgi:ATP-dependent RNA helicase DeaD